MVALRVAWCSGSRRVAASKACHCRQGSTGGVIVCRPGVGVKVVQPASRRVLHLDTAARSGRCCPQAEPGGSLPIRAVSPFQGRLQSGDFWTG